MAAKRARCDNAEEPLSKLRTPCYVAHLSKVKANAERMHARAVALGCQLRPHMKTHKTLQAGLIATGGTKRCIVVSTLAEAQFFANGGFDDILYAVPVTADKLDECAELCQRLEEFHVLVDNPVQVDALLARPIQDSQVPSTKRWSVVLMVDCGYHRDGVDPDDPASVALAKRLAESGATSFKGIYTHGGHSYDAKSSTEVLSIAEQERDVVVRFAAVLREAGITCDMIGVGSTPTCSVVGLTNLAGVNQMNPGNFIYYDMMQVTLGSCTADDVAVRVCTRVIGHYPKTNMLLIDLGWTGASAQGKEHGYGAIEGHPELRIKTLKQEAGEVEAVDDKPLDFSRYPIGTILRVLPWHSCASTHQHTHVHVLRDGLVADRWDHVRGW